MKNNQQNNAISRKEFDVLCFFVDADDSSDVTQRNISHVTKHSLGTINKAIENLELNGFLYNNKITSTGRKYLSNYEVKRAIIIAAGFGSRLVPITLNTPKPLIRVHGRMMIETQIDALLAAGIDDITIVRGYLKEQFDTLLHKYPMLKFVNNHVYNETNNISSIYQVRSLLQNTYVLEADLYIKNQNIIKKYHYDSNYLGIYKELTNDWCFTQNGNFISDVKIGGTDKYQMVGISYWNSVDGTQLKDDIESVWNMPGGRENFWDNVALVHHKKNYKVSIRECQQDDVLEIDNFSELKVIDPLYRN